MSAMPLRAPARVPPEVAGQRAAQVRRAAATLPRLRIVRAPARPRTRAPFIMLCVSVLVGALLGALFLNTSMASTAYEIHDRQIALARLSERHQELSQALEVAASPAVLAQRARAGGMVPAGAPAFVSLSDGTIIGESVPAAAVP